MSENVQTVLTDEASEMASAGMIARLGWLSYSQGFVCGLTAAQWTALRYFASANCFSRTVSAFAEHHATTRGTASQTVKSLVTQGLLTRTRSKSDGRSARIDLSERGRVLYSHDPFADLAGAIAELPQGLQTKLHSALERLTGRLAGQRQKPSFGACPSCLHLAKCPPCEGSPGDYFCRQENEPIEESSLEEICLNYQPGSGSPACQ
jgi:DNA-binding MarR family transcriptional regulator